MKVEFSPEADREADEGLAWWLAHRDKNPRLFGTELALAVKKLARTPFVGWLVEAPGLDYDVRYVPMKKTRFRIFYRVKSDTGVVEILRLWHMSRNDMPSF